MKKDIGGKFFTRDELDNAYRKHHDLFLMYARKLSKSSDSAQDIVSDVYLRLLKKNRFVKTGDLKAYFITCITRRYFSLKNQEIKRDALFSYFSGGELKSNFSVEIESDEDFESDLESERRSTLLREEVTKMPPSFRDGFLYHIIKGLPCKKAAEITGRSEGSIKNGAHRAYSSLKKTFHTQGTTKMPIMRGECLEEKLA